MTDEPRATPPLPGISSAPADGERRVDTATRLLRQALDGAWLTPSELGIALGVSASELDAYRARRKPMPAAVRLRLANALKPLAPAGFAFYADTVRAQALVELTLEQTGP